MKKMKSSIKKIYESWKAKKQDATVETVILSVAEIIRNYEQTQAFHASLPSSQSKLSTCRPSRLGAWRDSRSLANEMRCLGCLAVLLAAKGDPSLHERCARHLIPHYLTRPGPSSACYDDWIRVTSGMIRRKCSAYREPHRESRQLVLCAGFHGARPWWRSAVPRGRCSRRTCAAHKIGRAHV